MRLIVLKRIFFHYYVSNMYNIIFIYWIFFNKIRSVWLFKCLL